MWTSIIYLTLISGDIKMQQSKQPFNTESACIVQSILKVQYEIASGNAILAAYKCIKQPDDFKNKDIFS